MRLIYFAWVRERIGLPQEEVELPAEELVPGDLVALVRIVALDQQPLRTLTRTPRAHQYE